MKYPLTDYGTPEEEAWRWKFVPLYIRYQRKYDTYLWKVKYYDKPEGEDLLGKLVATNRITIPIGLIIGAADGLMHKNFTDFQRVSGRILHWTWPMVGIATAFTTTAYIGAKLRGKDDLWNYSAGAIAAGSVIGKQQKCHITGWTAATFFLIAAYAQRIRIEEGWKWWNFKEQEYGGTPTWHKFGWDIYKDPLPKGYTTSTEEKS